MTRHMFAAFGIAVLAGSALADGHATGDAEAGLRTFNQCKACHAIIDDAGETIIRGGRNGPNLYGVFNRAAASLEGFRYGRSLIAAGEAGLTWDEEQFLSYVQDPKDYLEVYLDDPRARSNMSFKLRDEEDALNVWAYLVSVGPDVEIEMDAPADEEVEAEASE